MANTSYDLVRISVISTIKSAFPSMKVYGEEISQGINEPCFFVHLFPASQKQLIGNRYKRYHAFDIHHFTNQQDANETLHQIAEKLYETLEYITVNGDIVRGANTEHEIIDGILHFYVHYDFHVYKEKSAVPLMEDLSVNTKIRGDSE